MSEETTMDDATVTDEEAGQDSAREDDTVRAPWGALHGLGETVSELMEGAIRSVSPAGARHPRLDLVRLPEGGYRVSVDLPGLEKSEVELTVVRGELQIAGKRDRPELPEGAAIERSERPYGRFRRTVPLPAGVDAARISARMTNGVLEIELPFAGGDPEQTIEVK